MSILYYRVSALKTPLAAMLIAAVAGHASAESNSVEYTVNGSTVTGAGTSSSAFFSGDTGTGYNVTIQSGANLTPSSTNEIQLDNGTVNIQSGATVSGGTDAIEFTGTSGTGTVTNAGTLSPGSYSPTILFLGNGVLNNTGTITESGAGMIEGTGSNLTVTNSGTIYEGYYGNSIAYGPAMGITPGTVTIDNTSSGIIRSQVSGNCFGTGIQIGGGAVANITNAGTIHSDAGCGGGDIQIGSFGSGFINNSGTLYASSNGGTDDMASIYLGADTNFSVTNSGTITMVGGGQAYGLQIVNSDNITINNSNLINVTTTGAGAYGIYVDGTSSNVAITNTGTIEASGGSTISSGIQTVAGSTGVAINNNGGTITGSNYGVYLGGNNSSLTTTTGGIITGGTDAIALAGTNDTVSVQGQSHIVGTIQGDVTTPGTPLAGNTLNLYLSNLTPTQIAAFKAEIISASTGAGTFTLGGDTYSWDSFSTVNLAAISTLAPQIDSGLKDIAGRLDNLPSILPASFDSFYTAAANNPESALNSLTGRQLISGNRKLTLNDDMTFGDLADARFFDIHNDTGANLNGLPTAAGPISVAGLGHTEDELAHWSAWISESITSAHQASTSESEGYEATINSPTIGIDYRATPDLTVGALLRSRSISVKYGDNSQTDIEGGLLGAYATYSYDDWFTNAVIGGGYSQYNNQRIALNGDTASSAPYGKEYLANISAGRDFQADGWHISPIAGLQYSHIGIDSYSENGAGVMDLSVDDQSFDSLRSKLGIEVSQNFEWERLSLSPNAQAGWYHELLNTNRSVDESLSGAPSLGDFGVEGTKPDKNFALLGVGLDVKPLDFPNDTTFFLNYNAQLGNQYSANTFYGGIRVTF